MTFEQAGTIASKVVDRWKWWQDALNGDFGQITTTPEQGYFRTRSKGGQWEPVAIWVGEDGEWLAYRNGREVHADDIWTWCCRQPITYESYQKAMDGGGFDDEPPAPIGHNSGDADPFEAISAELAGEAEQLTEFMKDPVKDQAGADRVGIWSKRMTDIAKRADGQRVIEKEPHLAASRAVDDKWRDVIASAKDLAARAKKHVEAFLIEQRRAEQERARKAAEEAERLRREAEEKAKAATPDIDAEAIEAERAEMLRKAEEAEKAAQAKNASAGRTGARVSIRVEKVAVVTDYGKAAAALVAMKHKDMIETIDRLAQRAAKAGMPFDGVEVKEVEKVV